MDNVTSDGDSPQSSTSDATGSNDIGRHAWVVESIAGVPTSEPKPQLTLGEDGRVFGTTGVNRIMGTYEAQDSTIKISGDGMTRMAGPPEAMDQERRFLRALEGWHAFHTTEGRLELGAHDTGMVMVAAAPPAADDSPEDAPDEAPGDAPA
jgi:heat shock protein HslJ